MAYIGYQCDSLAQWREILAEKLKTARSFEIHCWAEEDAAFALALPYGMEQPTSWNGRIAKGPVTPAFCRMLLELPEPADKEVYDKLTPFFSIFLDNGFSSEHYGTELNELP